MQKLNFNFSPALGKLPRVEHPSEFLQGLHLDGHLSLPARCSDDGGEHLS